MKLRTNSSANGPGALVLLDDRALKPALEVQLFPAQLGGREAESGDARNLGESAPNPRSTPPLATSASRLLISSVRTNRESPAAARGRSRQPLRSPTTGGSIGRESDKASSSSPRIGQRHLLVHCIGWDVALGLAATFAQPAVGAYGNSGYNAYLAPRTTRQTGPFRRSPLVTLVVDAGTSLR
jgi:hypothetical protein